MTKQETEIIRLKAELKATNDIFNECCKQQKQLKEENERLKNENISLEKMYELSKAFHDEKCAEFDRACYAIEKLQAENYQLRNKVKDANTAVKEFADKLKSEMLDREYNGIHYKWGAFSDNDIDELLKEYEND